MAVKCNCSVNCIPVIHPAGENHGGTNFFNYTPAGMDGDERKGEVMKVDRAASVPIILHDPYFSIWSGTDKLYESDTVHWCGKRQRIRGYLTVDGETFCFMGDKEFHQVILQTGLEITATGTAYTFENDKIKLRVSFTTPLLLEDPVLVSRPCTYVDFDVVRKAQTADVTIDLQLSADLVRYTPGAVVGGAYQTDSFSYAVMGKADQKPLGNSGDNITIDWGYVYLAVQDAFSRVGFDRGGEQLTASVKLGTQAGHGGLVIAYDDLLSINYFGEWKKAYWTETYDTILDAIRAGFADKEQVQQQCAGLDARLEEQASAIGGQDYALLCCLSYRHSIAAHKLITDKEGNLIFLSKENDSNGCLGTVDITYPSAPLYLLYNTEYVKGMLRPVFTFAACDVWEFDFAPHDVGRYPYATGQVYGLDGEKSGTAYDGSNGSVFPFFYQYPAGSGIYDFRYQMPVEECGNMLILTAAVCKQDGTPDFAAPYFEVLQKWCEYLLAYGADPGEQLCTDDFAGHLSHNVNLSAKAIMGIEAFALLAGWLGREETAEEYHGKAVKMAEDWEKRGNAGDHMALSFGAGDTWSLKYNMVWDKFFGSGLFREEVFQKEIDYYIKKQNTYGVPLDSRKNYTKSDWILWCAAMAEDREKADALIAPVAAYVNETPSRVPFSDWYETVSGEYCHFIARSVQGGIFMPVLMHK